MTQYEFWTRTWGTLRHVSDASSGVDAACVSRRFTDAEKAALRAEQDSIRAELADGTTVAPRRPMTTRRTPWSTGCVSAPAAAGRRRRCTALRLPIVRHIRAVWCAIAVARHYAIYAALGLAEICADDWVLFGIWHGWC